MSDTIDAPVEASEVEVATEVNNSGKLSIKEKLLMGTGGLPIFLGNNSVNALAMPFYNMILGDLP